MHNNQFYSLLNIEAAVITILMLKVELLSYHRDGYQIFSGVNFDIKTGTCMFVKGQNGSGKTTLLKILAGYLPIQQGNILINGLKISNNYDFIAQHIDYIGHLNAVKKQMTAIDNLKFWNSINEYAHQINFNKNFDDKMNINSFKDQLISLCSAGQIRCVALSRLNISNKKVWLLDEPTTSLDERSINNFKKMIETHCLNGGIAIIATHDKLDIKRIKSQSIEIKKPTGQQNSFLVDPFLTGNW